MPQAKVSIAVPVAVPSTSFEQVRNTEQARGVVEVGPVVEDHPLVRSLLDMMKGFAFQIKLFVEIPSLLFFENTRFETRKNKVLAKIETSYHSQDGID
ncbi:hypothetical protein RCL1_008125 [Eukaryota sp. TZLM3-RCL]